jgi:hypothetical protein
MFTVSVPNGNDRAIRRALPPDFDRLDELFELVKARPEYRRHE